MLNLKKKKIIKKRYPKISVIVPVYNQQQFIGRCIRSLVHQTISQSNYEIIIVNDGSTDLTKFAINLFDDPFDSFIRIINNKKNIGLPASLNKAIKISRSNFIIRVDSDDFVNSNFLNFLYNYIEMNSCDAVACDYLLIDDKENEICRRNSKKFPIACGILFRKNDLLSIGLYDETFLCNEEIDLRIRFEKKYKIEHLPLPLYRYRRHDKNITNNEKLMSLHKKNLNKKYSKKD